MAYSEKRKAQNVKP